MYIKWHEQAHMAVNSFYVKNCYPIDDDDISGGFRNTLAIYAAHMLYVLVWTIVAEERVAHNCLCEELEEKVARTLCEIY